MLKSKLNDPQMFRMLMLGAGVQSSTLLEMSIENVIPRFDLVLFADTGCEPVRVYKHLKYLKQRCDSAGVEFRVVRRTENANIMVDSKTSKFFDFPVFVKDENGRVSVLKRQCTKKYKLDPCNKEMRLWLFERGLARKNRLGRVYVLSKQVKIEKILGISYDERLRAAPSRVAWQTHVYPLVDMQFNRSDCVAWLKKTICQFHQNRVVLFAHITATIFG